MKKRAIELREKAEKASEGKKEKPRTSLHVDDAFQNGKHLLGYDLEHLQGQGRKGVVWKRARWEEGGEKKEKKRGRRREGG